MTARPTPVPRATYRLQLTKDFNFGDAAATAPYLGALGISHAYLSPVLKARAGSAHGYDTVDHSMLNPELGTLEDFRAMAAAFRAHGVGIVLDIVPNHVGIGGADNEMWLDLLEWGEQSRYARWFDVNWMPTETSLHHKVLVPFLGSAYADALGNGDLQLRFDETAGELSVWMHDTHKLPLALPSYAEVIGGIAGLENIVERCKALSEASEEEGLETVTALKRELAEKAASGTEAGDALRARVAQFGRPENADAFDALINAQHWRPARYSVAADDINYRRFFIVSDLAGMRVERNEVFEHVHKLTFQLVEEGLVDGLRVDHIDGLFDPKGYALKLRERCPRPIYLVVEKILAPHETVRADWQVDGTTGYEFITETVQLITDPEGEAALTSGYQDITGDLSSVDETERVAKFEIMDFEMSAELDAICAQLAELAASQRETSDLTTNSLRNGLRQYVASLQVYRTYFDGGPLSEADRREIAAAFELARNTASTLYPAVFDFLEQVVSGSDMVHDTAMAAAIARRIQQFSGPVMAKGLEDTALYRYNRFIASSDVGHRPDLFSKSIDAYHAYQSARQVDAPRGMLTSSSHDTKRGEDIRARLAVLSSRAEAWLGAVDRWRVALKQAGAPEIDANDAYYFFQMLLGAWPAGFAPDAELDPAAAELFCQRLTAAMIKSMREARSRTNWTLPDEDYESRVSNFVAMALNISLDNGFLADFRRFEADVALAGAQNGLIVAVLKLSVPGVPDIYQGAEFWEQSMVDPDNRRAVDFSVRAEALNETVPLPALLAAWRDGRIKQRVIATLLALRKARPALFAEGSYEKLQVSVGGSVLAFRRRHGTDAIAVAVRLYPGRTEAGERPTVDLGTSPTGGWRIELGEGSVDDAGQLRVDFDRLPVVVAVTE